MSEEFEEIEETEIIKPYLCLGTFMTQLLRFVDASTKPRLRAGGNSDDRSERLIYKGLINVYHMGEPYLSNATLKTYASDVKSCKKSRPEFAEFDNHDIRKVFEADIKKKNSDALQWMQDFVSDYLSLDTPERKERIVKIMFKMISEDSYIEPAQCFYILGNGKSIAKSAISTLTEIKIEALLLGVLHFIITTRSDKNEIGAETYSKMQNDKYKDWLTKFDIAHLSKITLAGRSGISEKTGETQEDKKSNESAGTNSTDNAPDDDPSIDEGSADNASKGFTITPNVTQYIQQQIVNNNKTIINTAPIDHIDTINF